MPFSVKTLLCPFCGEALKLRLKNNKVECKKCKAHGPVTRYRKVDDKKERLMKNIDLWNKRSNESDLLVAGMKTCPFCGSDEIYMMSNSVSCFNCHCSGPKIIEIGNKYKINLWNERLGTNLS